MTPRSIRNIGISAHIDAGKTTLSERILFYTGRIHRMGEVHDRQGGGATMDSRDIEKRKGITVRSAATRVAWNDHAINLIDTPGHVDFTIEVERALRVLDGAVLVLCATHGVQAQTRTVDRQMRRHGVPRIAFINKMDAIGADQDRVIDQIRTRLGLRPAPVTLPIGRGNELQGVLDVITGEAIRFDGEHGEDIVRQPCPAPMQAWAEARRQALVETIADTDETIAELWLSGQSIDNDVLIAAIRRATLAHRVVPVLCGSAYRNKGVQPLLDAVVRYLPSPEESITTAIDTRTNTEHTLAPDPEQPLVAYAFKIDRGRWGQLTYTRVYQGTMRKGTSIVVGDDRSPAKVGRIVRMHADQMEDVDDAVAGDIVGLFSLECGNGAALTDPKLHLQLRPMFVPDPVVTYAIAPKEAAMEERLGKALRRYAAEDPTLRVATDPESAETLVSGMGELHLEVYVEMMRTELGVEATLGPPQVAYRESPTRVAAFDVLHRKQGGGPGEYARIVGTLGPRDDEQYAFTDRVSGGAIPRELVAATDKGFRAASSEGVLVGAPVVGLDVVLVDGNTHSQDSNERAFRTAARLAFRDAMSRAAPVILEPIMSVEVDAPTEHVGSVHAALVRRRGRIVDTTSRGDVTTIEAEVPLREMFGFSTELRALTRGEGQYGMELACRRPVPERVQAELVAANKP
jgi:elongation factor G